jgi:hypothetical protein
VEQTRVGAWEGVTGEELGVHSVGSFSIGSGLGFRCLKTRDVAKNEMENSVPLATDFGHGYKRDGVPPDADS